MAALTRPKNATYTVQEHATIDTEGTYKTRIQEEEKTFWSDRTRGSKFVFVFVCMCFRSFASGYLPLNLSLSLSLAHTLSLTQSYLRKIAL